MADIIEQIQAYDIPHTSYMQAIRYMRVEHDDLSIEQSIDMIANLTDVNLRFETQEHAYLTLLYIVQEGIRQSLITPNVDTLALVKTSVQKAQDYINKNPWVFAKAEEEVKLDPVSGKPKMKKGKKQEMAAVLYQQYKEEGKDKIMEVFQEELDMSKAGARTYFYNMRKKFGDV